MTTETTTESTTTKQKSNTGIWLGIVILLISGIFFFGYLWGKSRSEIAQLKSQAGIDLQTYSKKYAEMQDEISKRDIDIANIKKDINNKEQVIKGLKDNIEVLTNNYKESIKLVKLPKTADKKLYSQEEMQNCINLFNQCDAIVDKQRETISQQGEQIVLYANNEANYQSENDKLKEALQVDKKEKELLIAKYQGITKPMNKWVWLAIGAAASGITIAIAKR